jgi:hypothetical protein
MADEAEPWFPEGYGQETADTICEMLADGKSLRAICREDGMPNKATVFRWLNRNEAFSDQYARAREAQADSLFDDMLEIADGHGERVDETGKTLLATDVQRDRLAVETRKWMAGKLKGKYSDKVKHVGGDEGDNPIAFTGFDIRFLD